MLASEFGRLYSRARVVNGLKVRLRLSNNSLPLLHAVNRHWRRILPLQIPRVNRGKGRLHSETWEPRWRNFMYRRIRTTAFAVAITVLLSGLALAQPRDRD